MSDQLTEDQLKLICDIHNKTGLSFDECRDAVLGAKGDGNELSRLLEEKAVRSSQASSSRSVGLPFGKAAAFVLSKLVGSILTSAVLCAGIMIVVIHLRGDPVGNVFTLIARNWWLCLAFGVFITFFRLFESDFWKSP